MIFTEDRDEMTALGRQIIDEHPELYPDELYDIYRERCGVSVPDEETLRGIICRAAYCHQLYGSSIEEFATFGFDRRTHRERLQYLTDCNHEPELILLNPYSERHLLNNKFEAYTLLKPYYKREAMLFSGEDCFDEFRAFAGRHRDLFVKPLDLSYAIGAHPLLLGKDADLRQAFEALLAESESLGRPLILEERIIPSPEIARFNPVEMSVLRVYTVLVRGRVHFFYPCIRLMCGNGAEKSGENYSIDALIDAETGELVTNGLHAFGEWERHPVSGVRIKGSVMPEWDALREMLTDAAHKLPKLRYIGWDVVHSDKGWCIIEGNAHAEFFTQMCVGHGVRKEFRRLIGWPLPPELGFLRLPLSHGYRCYWLILGKHCYQIKGEALRYVVRIFRRGSAFLRGRRSLRKEKR